MYIEALFGHREQMHGYDVSLSVSYMEIYRDEVYDLFVDRETVSHLYNLFRIILSFTELTSHTRSSPNRPLSYQSGRTTLVKYLSQTYLQYRSKILASSTSCIRMRDSALVRFRPDNYSSLAQQLSSVQWGLPSSTGNLPGHMPS
jgi:hypothetical protein